MPKCNGNDYFLIKDSFKVQTVYCDFTIQKLNNVKKTTDKSVWTRSRSLYIESETYALWMSSGHIGLYLDRPEWEDLFAIETKDVDSN